ncbi:DUF559 domain-containing protein [Mucilaginibacter sp. HMF5004]|uniref:endonuclease domain-containing protein n=1 Tax=Mucilaginibacter rivuli TaxID=2857527 RepID=UPI001C5E4594|nr:DUF559 domain-containing protein [Mucilaginibacter rivuli]MBW4889670.1 DUF559 domain-containing protein [Mucilaginibacter rivuli]
MKRKIIPYNSKLKQLARSLRNDSTLGEILLWKELNNKQFYSQDFHRQKPLLNYIVDFYCYELNLVIEIDGMYHNHEEKNNSDILRDKELESFGLTVIRFTEKEVRQDMINIIRTLEDYYLTFIEKHAEEHTPNPSQEGN